MTIEERQRLIVEHLDLAGKIASGFMRRLPPSVEFDDVHQAACVGLIDAANKHDWVRGAPFEAYATIRIKGAIRDHLRSMDWFKRRSVSRYKWFQQSEMVKRGESFNMAHDSEIILSTLVDHEAVEQHERRVMLRLMGEAISWELSRLKEHHRITIELHHIDGVTLREIARRGGVTESAVSHQADHVRKLLSSSETLREHWRDS